MTGTSDLHRKAENGWNFFGTEVVLLGIFFKSEGAGTILQMVRFLFALLMADPVRSLVSHLVP